MKRLAVATLFGSLLAFAPAAFSQAGPADAPRHVLNLDDVEITSLIDDVSIITGYTFILHPDVRRTKVTVMSQIEMSWISQVSVQGTVQQGGGCFILI